MSGRYVPPSRRNQHPVQKKEVEINNLNDFPSLTNSGPKSRFLPTKRFSELASEWNVKAVEDKEAEEYRKSARNREIEEQNRNRQSVVSFNNIHVFNEESRDDEEQNVPLIQKKDDDEWTTIDRKKIIVELSAEEKDAKARRQEEMYAKQEETMWIAGQSDSDWGFRDRRAIQ